MNVVEVDVVGVQPAQALFHRMHHVLTRQVSATRNRRGRLTAELGCKDPAVAIRLHGAADDLLRTAAAVHISGVDEVHTGVARLCDDAMRSLLIRLVAEHHGAQA